MKAMTRFAFLMAAVWGLGVGGASAATNYVWQGSPNPTPPYSSWQTAANVIQDAVDAALAGDEVLVTNGVYDIGGAVTPGYACMNRVVITNDIAVRSVNGPEATFIVGQGPQGSSAVRGLYLSAGLLSGFTITNGHTLTSGDWIYDLSGGGVNMAGGSGVVTNCVLTGNSAGGDFFSGGGGSYGGTLNKCTLTGNSADYSGGGSYGGTLNNCVLTGNSAGGSGLWSGGGGSSGSTLNNCSLSGNSAGTGGGSSYGTLNNCTLTGNSASDRGGGFYGEDIFGSSGTLNNCIVYFNAAVNGGDNLYASRTVSYCCTIPDPGGVGNITNDPLLVSSSHIATNSPCRGAGSVTYASGTDIDGEPWLNPPSMGCDENAGFGSVTGAVSFALLGPSVIVEGWTDSYTPIFMGPVTRTTADFGNGLVVTNPVGAVRTSWPHAGLVEVRLSAWNDDHPGGITFTQTIEVLSATATAVYVSEAMGNDANDGHSWATAKQTIQAGVNAQGAHGGVVWVANGVYDIGGAVTPGYACLNRVVITNPIAVRSVNGPEATFIVGQGPRGSNAVRGVYMSAGLLNGFTITNGHTFTSGDWKYDSSGGGVNMAGGSGVVSDCVLAGNSAAASGGGSTGGTLNNCTLTGNSATWSGGGSEEGRLNSCLLTGNSAGGGGGSWGGRLNNCTLAGNSATYGGGSEIDTLNNCIVYYNSAGTSGDNYSGGSFNYCCTDPLPAGGQGNISAAPLFEDPLGWSNLRLQSNSPCIDAGHNDLVTRSTDLDGNPRIINGIVDMGAYEFVPPTPAELVEQLVQLVNESDLLHKQPLLATLDAALASIERDNCHSAVGQLRAFQNKVAAQVSDTAFATDMVASAARVITALDCDGAPHVAARIHSFKRHPNGKVQMKINGEPGKVYLLEASTNLVDWMPICVVRPDAEGNCCYEEAEGGNYASRFYRLVGW